MYLKALSQPYIAVNGPVMLNFAVTEVRGGVGVCVWGSGLRECPIRHTTGQIYSFDMVHLQHVSFDSLKETAFYKKKKHSEKMINTLNHIHKLVSTPAFWL